MKAKFWDIYKENSHDGYCTTIKADSEKSALREYRKGLTSSGFSGIVKRDGKYFLETTYGACFAAYESLKGKEGPLAQRNHI